MKTARTASVASLASTCTIKSYDGGAPAVPAQQMYNLPIPQTQSVYGGFGGEEADPFEDADEDEEEHGMEREEGEERSHGRRDSKAGTSWGQLY